jgi:indole-3-glycerol phosphate synthase
VSGFLAQVCAEARDRVAAASAAVPLPDLRAAADQVATPASFLASLQSDGVGIIAEVKRASPSRGPLAEIPDAAALALAYANGGAAAISVLTEPAHFRGSLEDLEAVAGSVPVPVLRKDFVVDPYQVWEARRAGAAAVLLIVVALEQDDLVDLLRTVEEAGLVALLETHDELEVTRATGAYEAAGVTGKPIIGVNARDLTTLEVDPRRFAAVRDLIPEGVVAVAESGVKTAQDVRRLGEQGADAVLVGESVATAGDPKAAVGDLVAAGLHAR